MKLTKKLIVEMIEETILETDETQVSPEELEKWEEYNNEVREERAQADTAAIVKKLKGWWKAALVDQKIRQTLSDKSEDRAGDYSGKVMGTDEFFKKYYVGKSFKLEFLNRFVWQKTGRFTRKYYPSMRTISLAITDLIEEQFPEIKKLSDWAYNAMNKEQRRVYGQHDNVPHVRIRMAIGDLAMSIMLQNQHEAKRIKHLKDQIKLGLELKDSNFDYAGKLPVDFRGYTPREFK